MRPKQCYPKPVQGEPSRPAPSPVGSVLTDPANAPLGTAVVYPRWQDRHHPREIAIRWSPPLDLDEQHPWLIVGSEGPQVLSNDSVTGCEVLVCSLVDACASSSTDD